MSSTKKIILGILTILPFVFMVIYFIEFFSIFLNFFNLDTLEPIAPEVIYDNIGRLFFYSIATMILTIGLMIYYIIDIVNNPKFQNGGNSKLIWILVVILASMIGMIAYFLTEVYPRKKLPPLPYQRRDY